MPALEVPSQATEPKQAGTLAGLMAGLPMLGLLALGGRLTFDDVPVLMLMPLTWGAVTGVGLTAWAYESRAVRRWGEAVSLGGVLLYLAVGVLAGENLRLWLTWLPAGVQWWFMELFGWFHTDNPFAVLQFWLQPQRPAARTGASLSCLQPSSPLRSRNSSAIAMCSAARVACTRSISVIRRIRPRRSKSRSPRRWDVCSTAVIRAMYSCSFLAPPRSAVRLARASSSRQDREC